MIVRYTVDIKIDTNVTTPEANSVFSPETVYMLSAMLEDLPEGSSVSVLDALKLGIVIGIRKAFRGGYLPEFVTVVDFQDCIVGSPDGALGLINERAPVQDGAKHEPAKRPQNE